MRAEGTADQVVSDNCLIGHTRVQHSDRLSAGSDPRNAAAKAQEGTQHAAHKEGHGHVFRPEPARPAGARRADVVTRRSRRHSGGISISWRQRCHRHRGRRPKRPGGITAGWEALGSRAREERATSRNLRYVALLRRALWQKRKRATPSDDVRSQDARSRNNQPQDS